MKYVVTNSAASGRGSLAWAVDMANANQGEDIIRIKVGNIELTEALLVTDDLKIQGNGVVITQTGNDRLFTVDDGTDDSINLTLRNLSLTGGNPTQTGGAILAYDNVKLNKVNIYGNRTAGRGGAIYSEADLVVRNSRIYDNVIDTNPETSAGGAIYSRFENASLKLIDSEVSNNTSATSAIAIGFGATGKIRGSQISDNDGSGIGVVESSLVLKDSTVSGNVTEEYNGGGLDVLYGSEVVIKDSTISDNTAVFGGGISVAVDSSVKLKNSAVVDNVALEDGGAIDLAEYSQLTLKNSTVSGNSGYFVDGIANYDGTSDVRIIDSVIADTVEENIFVPGSVEALPEVEADVLITDAERNPVRIEAEDADRYEDSTSKVNFGGEYRHDEAGLDIEVSSGGGYNVGWIEEGEYLEYDVDIAQSGTYDVLLRVATNIWDTKEIEVSVDDVSVGTVSFGHTGGWQSYTDVIIENVSINAGTNEIRLDALDSQFNVDYLELI